MSKDWQIGSNFVKEPKITKIPGKNKEWLFGDAETIEATQPYRISNCNS